MADTGAPVTTPASAGSSNTPAKVAAPKDRTCPYCHVSFTSSSLGRHLDLYIKEKNPKPPDGIHDVDEIRKSRGAITRRQARSSAAKRQQDAAQRSGHDGQTNGVSPGAMHGDRKNGTQYFRQLFNTPHWTSTGVITDSDANVQLMEGNGGTPIDLGKDGPGSHLDAVTRRKWHEERERGRAAELALQEVLDSIKAAAPQREKPEIYDFDFFAYSFPNLCLKILPAPPTLLMPTLIPSPDSWPVNMPNETTYDVLRRNVARHLLKWRDDYYPPNPRKRPRSLEADAASLEPWDSPLEPVPLYMHHLRSAFASWKSLTSAEKEREWLLEAMRAYAAEKDQHIKTRSRIEYLETELARAKLDNARLTECQMPREWLHAPASQLPIAKLAADKVDRELTREGLDAEKLISKWRGRVQDAKGASRRPDADDRETGRLVMVGPAGINRLRSEITSSYDGRIPDGSEDEDDDDEGDEDDDDGDEITAEGRNASASLYSREAVHRGPIEPSLRSQMEGLANRHANGSRTS